MKSTKKEQQDGQKPQKPAQKQHDRTKPTSDRLVSAIEGGRLGDRTALVRRLQATRRALAEKPVEAAQTLLRDQVAILSVITACQLKRIARDGADILDDAGGLNPHVARLLEHQKSLLNALQGFLRLQAAQPGKGKAGGKAAPPDADSAPLDVSAIVLELAENQTK